jgi:ubiquinone/menaquinone biosynthesis C-methylase UbiE
MNNDSKKSFVEAAFDAAAPIYNSEHIFDGPGQALVKAAGLSPGWCVLDIACGRGAVLFPALDAVGSGGFVEAIDLAPTMVELTSAELKRRGIANATVRRMDAEHLDFPDASFDAVTCGFALWFIPRMDLTLSEVARVLKPGGVLATSTWGTLGDLQRQFQQVLRPYGVGASGLSSHSLATPRAIEEALSSAGFVDLRLSIHAQSGHFDDEEDWWARAASSPQIVHGLTPEQFEEVHSQVLTLAKGFNDGSGITMAREANIATCRSPQP